MKFIDEFIKKTGCDINEFDAQKYVIWLEAELTILREKVVGKPNVCKMP